LVTVVVSMMTKKMNEKTLEECFKGIK